MTARHLDAALKRWWKRLTSRKPPFGKLICRVAGHKWRRLMKKERESPGFQIWAGSRDGTVAQMRRCDRCEAERLAKTRKKANPKPKL